MVESQPSKLLVAGSIPVSRSNLRSRLQFGRELRLASHAKVVPPKRKGAKADLIELSCGRLVGRSSKGEGPM